MSDDILHFSVCFHGVGRKYGRSSGCPTHGMLSPGGVLNAVICLGRTDCKGQLICDILCCQVCCT